MLTNASRASTSLRLCKSSRQWKSQGVQSAESLNFKRSIPLLLQYSKEKGSTKQTTEQKVQVCKNEKNVVGADKVSL